MILQPRVIFVIVAVSLAAVTSLVINPLEQFRRIQDGQVETEAEEFLEAVERYYKVFFEYPWEALGQSDPDETVVQHTWIEELVTKGETNPEFADCSSWNQIYITQNVTAVYACFDPISEKFQQQADEESAFGCLGNCWRCLSPISE